MNGKGLFSKLFDSKTPYQFFFGIQIVIGTQAKDKLRKELYTILSYRGDEELPEDKKVFYKAISSVLLKSSHTIEYAYWDYILKPTKAEDEFHIWINKVETSSVSEKNEINEKVGKLSNDKPYFSFIMVFLLKGSEQLKLFMDIIGSITKDEAYFKNSIKKVIEAINHIDFEYSYGDACFIMPGNEKDKLVLSDIKLEGWELEAVV
jgi:hypothetical protein